jgi:hypothetical protein
VAAALTPAAAAALVLLSPSWQCFPPAAAWQAPERDAVRFIREHDLRGRALVFFDFGEYAIFHVRDRLQVSIDNRRETVYSAAIVDAHRKFYDGGDPGYADAIGADLVWLPRQLPAIPQLEARGWHRRFEGPQTVILLRQAGPVVTTRERSLPCFPNP